MKILSGLERSLRPRGPGVRTMDPPMYITILSLLIIFYTYPSHGQTSAPVKQFPEEPKVHKTKQCNEDLQVKHPYGNGLWPNKIVKFNYHHSTTSPISLDISWTADIKNVKGFRIHLKQSDGILLCRILDYKDVITNKTGQYAFDFRFNRIRKNKNFTLTVCPLPKLDDETTCVSTDFQTSVFVPIDCSQFAPKVSYIYDGKHMEVSFDQGPDSCNYKQYEIIVMNQTSDTVLKKYITAPDDNKEKVRTYFKLDICEGYHEIWASVFDENFSEFPKCVCKNDKTCDKCPSYKISVSDLIPAKSCTPKVIKVPEEPKRNSLLLPLAIVIGILSSTALFLYIAHWILSVRRMVKKQGIVLLLDDHENHTNAVQKLVKYLNENHLKVSLASAFLRNHDIPDQMVVMGEVLKSDFVLLVLSSALHKRMEAWNKQQDYVEFFKEKNSNILTKALLELLTLSSNKLHVCKFDHVVEFGNWPKPCYSLPSDLNRLVTELSGQSFSQRVAICNCLASNTLGSELQGAFKKTVMYEQSHPTWFKDKYVCPTNVAMFQYVGDETSVGESVYMDPRKLKQMFPGYKNIPNNSIPEESIAAPSIYSVPISDRLQELNERNI